MKKVFTIIICMVSVGIMSAQTSTQGSTANANSAEFQWVSEVYDFGSIPQGIPTKARYEFTNVGNEALIITDVQKSCGCTSTDWTKEPIAPGQKGWIMAEFNAASPGGFTKTITVVSNSKTPTMKLTFKGNVVKDDGGSVPQQSSIFNQ